ncbi:MAG: hypothetical protein PGN24_00155 [Microbacterium arborescens]
MFVYVVYDRRGEVDDYVLHALRGMREHAARVLVVVNGVLTDGGRERLASVSDEVLVRENVGFDIWAHKAALEHVGAGIEDFDEVVLTNDTWFGPVRPYGPVLERMGERAVHFWGMTDHAREEPNPFTGKGVLPYHLQSFWIAVRREMFLSEDWRRYWAELPEMPSYFDAVLKHETIFTEYFADRGFTHDVAYGQDDYPTDHPALFNPDLLMADGCPVLKRRPFFHWPPFLDRHAVIGREILAAVEGYGYPVSAIYGNLARTVPPFTVNTNAGLLDVLDEGGDGYDAEAPLRIAVVAHIPAASEAGDLLTRLTYFPDPVDVFVTTADPDQVEPLQSLIEEMADESLRIGEVRLVPTEDGRDMSGFFVACADVITDPGYDLVFKMHARDGSRHGSNIATYRRRYLTESLLGSPGTTRSLLARFQRESGLGVAFPPPIHIGYATTGGAWSWYRGRAEELCRELGIRVPFDGVSPLAPLGGMWVARPAALQKLAARAWTYADFRDRTASKIPDLARTLERLVAYSAGEDGFHARTVVNAEHAALSHTALEYKLDQLATTTPGYPVEQIQFLHRAGWAGTGGAVAFFRMYMRTNHSGIVERLDPLMAPVGRAARSILRAGRSVAAVPRRLKGARR